MSHSRLYPYNREYDGASEQVMETWTYTPLATYNVLGNLNGVTITAPDGGVTAENYAQIDTINVSPPSIPEQVKGEMYKSEAADGTVIEKYYTSNVPTYPYLLNKANR